MIAVASYWHYTNNSDKLSDFKIEKWNNEEYEVIDSGKDFIQEGSAYCVLGEVKKGTNVYLRAVCSLTSGSTSRKVLFGNIIGFD